MHPEWLTGCERGVARAPAPLSARLHANTQPLGVIGRPFNLSHTGNRDPGLRFGCSIRSGHRKQALGRDGSALAGAQTQKELHSCGDR
jgi:hypothetical protein